MDAISNMGYVWYLLILVALYLAVKLFSAPIKLLLNGVCGGIFLFVFNYFGAGFGFELPLNVATACIVGFFGVPGFFALIVVKYLVTV